jgi:hypothetical protein
MYRYYRANSVRYPTQPCEGICSLNHYCAITRIDYREYRQCLDSAASALASNTRPGVDVMSTQLLLLLIALIHLYIHQRTLLMQLFLIAIHVNCSVVSGIFSKFHYLRDLYSTTEAVRVKTEEESRRILNNCQSEWKNK